MSFIPLPNMPKLRIMMLLSLLLGAIVAKAQAPTSLTYPTPNVYIANVSNVYLAPTVVGSVTSYSISPTLPSGLSFNTNTGVISGMPTAASANTGYTVTATNASGSATKTVNITVTNNYFNNAYDTIRFGGGTGPTLVTITNIVGDGTAVGNIVLYKNVAQLSGTQIDCIVTTRSLSGGSFSAYDQPAATGGSWNSNDPKFFSPQFSFTTAGSAIFDFQFILGNSFDTATHTGSPVVLQNVRINTYDIDGNNGANSNQYNEFGGFTTSEVSSATTISAAVYDTSTGLTKYRSSTNLNRANVTSDSTRVRLSYDNISDFTIQVGAGASGSAYFFIDFSAGPAFSTATPTSAPSLDLNTSLLGTSNAVSGCGTGLAMTATSQTNVTSPAALTQVSITYDNTSANIPDGASEKLVISGGTPVANDTLALNFTNGGTSTVTLGGVSYTITTSVSGSTSKIAFTNGSTFTVANAEALMDALTYVNVASAPTAGKRVLTAKVGNAAFESPDADFTATLTCVSISGSIYHDINGLTDNTINASGTAFAANTAYAVLVNPSNNQVLQSKGIAADGSYSFGTASTGTYLVYVSSSTVATGATFSAATFPGLYKSVGENLGSGTGSDLLADGTLRVTVGSSSASNLNFGLELAPVITNTSYSGIANPGGYNAYTLGSGAFNATDADGSVNSITITSFPTGANYLKVGSTVYTSGGTCPPQSTCTTWPGSVAVPFSSGNPTQAISIDPTADGNTSITINYTATDNAGLSSSGGSIALSFTGAAGTNYLSISGNVWDDADGDGVQNGSEALTAAAAAGQTLYAVVVQTSNTYSGQPTVFASAAVSASSGYTFTDNIPTGNNYEVRLVSAAAAPTAGVAASNIAANLASGWIAVSTTNSGVATTGLSTNAPVIAVSSLASAKSNMNFGIEQTPTTDAKSFTISAGYFSPTPPAGYPTVSGYLSIQASSTALTGYANGGSLTGSDPEDCASAGSCNSGKTFAIASINANTKVYYDNGSGATLLTTGSTLTNFNAAKLVIYGARYSGSGGNPIGFTYKLTDAAGQAGSTAAYNIGTGTTVLPVVIADLKLANSGRSVRVDWTTGVEINIASFAVERSVNGTDFATVGKLGAKGSNSVYQFVDDELADGLYYYRLRATEYGGTDIYSNVLSAKVSGVHNSVAMYPNPATTNIKVSGLTGDATVTLFDLSGRVVMVASDATNNKPIDIAQIPAGAYVVRIVGASGAVTNTHLIKQ